MIQKEIVSALVADRCRENADLVNLMQSDSKSTMNELCDKSLPVELDVHTVQNTSGLVHVPLPVYKSLPDISDVMSDEDLAAISGGEIALAAIIIGTIGGIAVISALAVSTVVVGSIVLATLLDPPNQGGSGSVTSGGDTI